MRMRTNVVRSQRNRGEGGVNWCEKHDHFKRTCPWCEIEEMKAQLDQALEALERIAVVDVFDWSDETFQGCVNIARQAIQQIKGDAM